MRTAKLVIGIISIVLCAFVLLQSCVAGIGNVIEDNGESSGTAGFMVALLMLVSGIVGISTRNNKGGGITAGVFYAIAGLIGICNYGSYSDLAIWSVLCFIFAIIFIVGSATMKKSED